MGVSEPGQSASKRHGRAPEISPTEEPRRPAAPGGSATARDYPRRVRSIAARRQRTYISPKHQSAGPECPIDSTPNRASIHDQSGLRTKVTRIAAGRHNTATTTAPRNRRTGYRAPAAFGRNSAEGRESWRNDQWLIAKNHAAMIGPRGGRPPAAGGGDPGAGGGGGPYSGWKR